MAGGPARISGMLGPNGGILHSGASGVSFGERDGSQHNRRWWRSTRPAGRPASRAVSIDISQDLWDKWVMLGTIATMCAAMRGTVGDIVAAEDGAALMSETLDECCRVAAANGHAPNAKVRASLEAGLTQPGSKAVASILGDMEKGGAVEARSIVGDMLARARKAGLPAPNLRFAYAHLQAYEARRARGALK